MSISSDNDGPNRRACKEGPKGCRHEADVCAGHPRLDPVTKDTLAQDTAPDQFMHELPAQKFPLREPFIQEPVKQESGMQETAKQEIAKQQTVKAKSSSSFQVFPRTRESVVRHQRNSTPIGYSRLFERCLANQGLFSVMNVWGEFSDEFLFHGHSNRDKTD